MVKRISLNDDQFREIMVREKAAEDLDREEQHEDRKNKDSDQAVSRKVALANGGNDQAVRRDLSASQKQLVSDGVETNLTIKKASKLVLIQRLVLKKLDIMKEKQSSMAYEDSINKLKKEYSIEGTL